MTTTLPVVDAVPLEPPPPRTAWLRYARPIVTVVVMVGVAVSVGLLLGGSGKSHGHFGKTGLGALAISFPLLTVAGWSWLPSETIAIGQGAAYGFFIGTIANVAGWTLSSVIQYLMVKHGLMSGEPEALLERAPKFLRKLPTTHPLFLIGARQLPFGSKLVNFLSPAVGVSLRRHTWCAAAGVLPTAVVCAALGTGLLKI